MPRVAFPAGGGGEEEEEEEGGPGRARRLKSPLLPGS